MMRRKSAHIDRPDENEEAFDAAQFDVVGRDLLAAKEGIAEIERGEAITLAELREELTKRRPKAT
jgi:hypothetical protein